MKCVRLASRLLFSTLFLSLALSPCFAQVVISESNYQALVKNLQLVKIELKNWGDSLNQREQALSEREASLTLREESLKKKEQDLIKREQELLAKEKVTSELRNSLTIASESLRQADEEAVRLEAENKLLKIGGVAGWAVAAIAIILIFIPR